MKDLHQEPKKEQVKNKNNNNQIYQISLGITTYTGKELEERRKSDWSESKQIIPTLYPRWRKGE